MGTSVAAWGLFHGLEIKLYVRDSSKFELTILKVRKNLRGVVEKSDLALRMLSLTNDLTELQSSSVIFECLSEDFDVKIAYLTKILKNSVRDSPIVCTVTSSIPIELMSQSLNDPPNFMAAHFFNPVIKCPVVELCPTNATSENSFEVIKSFLELNGLQTVKTRSRPGFLVNHLLFEYLNAALLLFFEEKESCADIDRSMKLACNHPMGPFQLIDFIGLDVTKAILINLSKNEKYAVSISHLDTMIEAGKLGRKNGLGFYNYKVKE